MICQIEDYQIVTKPTYQTIQIGRDLHLEELGIIAYMNHSCQPNTIVDTTTLTIRANREIAPGESLTFFYPSTEWEMDRPFVCLCGAPSCIRLVAGARYLSVDVLRHYFINQHVRELIAEALLEETSQIVPFVPAMMGRAHNGYYANGVA
ncbi:MAG: SET domain-containing protein-lysine N-methyltransferase [Caldilineaceae bacterium]